MAEETVLEATKRSVRAAGASLGDLDAGAVATLLEVARAVDTLAANGGIRDDGKLDNVSIPTYLKFCESLGLTPAGRAKLPEKKPEAPGGKLALLRGDAQSRKTAG